MVICKSINLSIDTFSDPFSITVKGEKLDIGTMIRRAQAGILDIRQFQVPRMADMSGSNLGGLTQDQAVSKLGELLDRPNSIMDNAFGSDRETAEKELNNYSSILKKVSEEKKDDKETAADKDKVDEKS